MGKAMLRVSVLCVGMSVLGLTLGGCSGSSPRSAAVTPATGTATSSTSSSATSASSVPSTPAATSTTRGVSGTGVRLTAKVGDTVSASQLAKQTQRAMRGKSFHLTMTSAGASGLTADALVSRSMAGDAAMRMTEKIAGAKVELSYVHDVMYVSVPSQGAGWVAIRQGGTDPLSKQLAPLLAQMKQSMSGNLGELGGVVWRVAATSPTEITYRAYVSAAQARSRLTKLGLGAVAGSISATGEDITEVISPSGLPVSTSVSMGGVTTMQLRYDKWGPAVDIKAPADAITPPAA